LSEQHGLSFSADASTLAIADFRKAFFWSVPAGKMLYQLDWRQDRVWRGLPLGPSLSSDGKIAGLARDYISARDTGPGRITAIDVAGRKTIGPLDTIQNQRMGVIVAPDGKTLVSFGGTSGPHGAGPDAMRTLQVWDVATGKESRRITLQCDTDGFCAIHAAAVSPDGKTLAVASDSGYRLIDFQTGKELRRFAGRGSIFASPALCFSPDGDILAAFAAGNELQAWEVKTGKRIDTDEGPKTPVLSVAFPGQGRILAMGAVGQSLQVWDAHLNGKPSPFRGHLNAIHALAFADGGKTVISAGADHAMIYWAADTGKETRRVTFTDEETRLGFMGRFTGSGRRSLAFSPDGRYAATVREFDGDIGVISLKTGRTLLNLRNGNAQPGGLPTGFAFSADGSRLAAIEGFRPSCWDITTGQSVGKLPALRVQDPYGPPRLAISPDGKLLAMHAVDTGHRSDLIVWDLDKGEELHRSARVMLGRERLNASGSLAFSPKNRYLAVAELEGVISVLDAESGREIQKFRSANRDSVLQLAFSPDLRFLTVGAAPVRVYIGKSIVDAPTIEVFELASGELRDRFVGHIGGITCLAFSPDAGTLASGSIDTTILLWDMTGKSDPQLAPLGEREIAPAWQALSATDALTADTLRRLTRTPGTLAFLKRNFPPAKPNPVDEERHATLIADLDSASFKRRDAALRELKTLGERAETALKNALAAGVSIEARRRIQDVLDQLEARDVKPEELQAIRGVEVLERIGNQEARELLAALAKGDPSARVTREASLASKRLERK
jgi:WD40 repeat protein